MNSCQHSGTTAYFMEIMKNAMVIPLSRRPAASMWTRCQYAVNLALNWMRDKQCPEDIKEDLEKRQGTIGKIPMYDDFACMDPDARIIIYEEIKSMMDQQKLDKTVLEDTGDKDLTALRFQFHEYKLAKEAEIDALKKAKPSIQLLTERTSMFLAQLSANLKIDGASLQCAAGESHSSAMTRLVAGSANTFTSTDSSKISTSEPQLVVSGLDNSSGIYVVDWSVSTANPVDAAVLGSKVSTYSLLFANGSAIGDGTGVSVILAIPFKYALADYGLPTNATGLRYTGVCRHVTGASWSTASVSTAGREQH
eukprot:5776_1